MHRKKTILVVEDEKSLRDAIVDILHFREFIHIDEAKNGKEGLKSALLNHPDIILLDLIMPDMDGATALKKIREDSWGKNVPVIILTNLSSRTEEGTSNPLTQYLIKSDWKIHDIAGRIEDILKSQ